MSAQLSERLAEGRSRGRWRRDVIILACGLLLLLLGACVPGLASDQPTPQPAPSATPAPAHDPGVDFFQVVEPVTPGYLHCSQCHEPAANELETWMPHPLEDREQCLLCHSTRSVQPFDESHNAVFNQSCQLCHMPAKIEQ